MLFRSIDLPQADPVAAAAELAGLVGCDPEEVLAVSGKTGAGVAELLRRVVERVPPPSGDVAAPLRALVFDSSFDPYRGVIAYVRVRDGRLPSRTRVRLMAGGVEADAEEAGVFAPEATPVAELGPGEVGYLVTGMKDVHLVKVGDTVTAAGRSGAT